MKGRHADDTELDGRTVSFSVEFNVVLIEIACAGEYEAQVLYDDICERVNSNKNTEITISMQKERGK